MKKFIGYSILFSLFAGWCVFNAYRIGIFQTASALLCSIGIIGTLYLAIFLIVED